MDITYIEHSGFVVETENNILLFDYYRGAMPDFDRHKNIFVFASHQHEDHFTFEIFKLAEKYGNITYILSNDIKRKYNKKYFEKRNVSEEVYDKIIFMGAYEKEEIKGITVETLKSTDMGVAFVMESDGKKIYHSGDLNDWTWQGEPPADNEAMTRAYRGEIDRLKGRHFDVAFAVVDPRQGKDFYRGVQYLFENITADVFLPMHFWHEADITDKLREHPCAVKFRDIIVDKKIYTQKPYKITM